MTPPTRLPSPSKISRPVFFAVTTFCVLLVAWSPPIGAQPFDDHFAGLESQALEIPLEKLLGNDIFSAGPAQPGALADLIEVIQPPHTGILSTSADGSKLLYFADIVDGAPYVGRDRFQYRLTAAGAPEGTATVTLDVRPEWSPVVGRWFEDGSTPEARGYFHSADAFFRLCHSLEGIECQDFPVSSKHRLWAPMSIDLDGDGIDELMLHDSQHGSLVTFALEVCEYGGGLCLQEIESRDFGETGEVATVGKNYLGDVWFGLFAPTSGRWRLQRNGYPSATTLFFDPTLGEEVPLLAAWNDSFEVTPGVFDPSTGLLHVLNHLSGSSTYIFDPSLWAAPVGPYLVTNGQVGDSIGCPFLMLFERDRPTIHLYQVFQCNGGQVYRSVPTDPSGRAKSLPSDLWKE